MYMTPEIEKRADELEDFGDIAIKEFMDKLAEKAEGKLPGTIFVAVSMAILHKAISANIAALVVREDAPKEAQWAAANLHIEGSRETLLEIVGTMLQIGIPNQEEREDAKNHRFLLHDDPDRFDHGFGCSGRGDALGLHNYPARWALRRR